MAPPSDGHELFLVEDNLTHQIRLCLVIIDAGVKTSFSRNPYLKSLMRDMYDRHRPTYWLKTLHIIRCIIGVLTEDIYLFMTENFLKYETSFVASTSELWWDIVSKNSVVAYIGYFMANRYTFKNGGFLFFFDTTMKSIYKDAL